VAAEFGRRAQCLVDQYSMLAPLAGHNVDGAFTLGENIADVGGVKLAYAAWQARGEAERTATWLTGSQQFFTSYAQSWCEEATDAYADLLLVTDPHAPARFRVDAVLADTPAFAAAFRCPAGAPMAPENRCQVW
jgi:putative endopeptidase